MPENWGLPRWSNTLAIIPPRSFVMKICLTCRRFLIHSLAVIGAVAGSISCVAQTDPGLMQKVQAISVKQMGVFTSLDGATYAALVVEVSNASPYRIVIEKAELGVTLKRQELEGVLPERVIEFGSAIVTEEQVIAASGAATPVNSCLRMIVPIGDAAAPETLLKLGEMFNLLAGYRWHEDETVRKKLGGTIVLLSLNGPVQVRVGDEKASESSARQLSFELEMAQSSDPVFVSRP